MANNQTYDKIHDEQSRHSSLPEMINNESNTKTQQFQSVLNNNSFNKTSTNINHDDINKTIDQISTDKNSTNNQTIPCTFDGTNQLVQCNNTENNDSTPKIDHSNKLSIKTNEQSLKYTVQNKSPDEDNDNNNRQRSLSSSSSSSTSSDNQISNIPYEILYNEDDDDDDDSHKYTNEITNPIGS